MAPTSATNQTWLNTKVDKVFDSFNNQYVCCLLNINMVLTSVYAWSIEDDRRNVFHVLLIDIICMCHVS